MAWRDKTLCLIAKSLVWALFRANHEAFSKRVVDQLPNELSLYLPPKKVGGVIRPASLCRKDKVTPL
jgi:hypothetical protein